MSEEQDQVTPQPQDESSADADVAVENGDDARSAFAFSPEREAKFQELVRRYPTNYSAIMPTLWLCQEEWGWLRPGLPEWVAERLDVPLSRVYEIITFYTMYYTEDCGRYNLQVCRNISCHMAGSRKITEHISKKLGIDMFETDEDGLFRLEEVECLGACGMAPMMQVGNEYYEHLTPEKVDQLIDQWRRDG